MSLEHRAPRCAPKAGTCCPQVLGWGQAGPPGGESGRSPPQLAGDRAECPPSQGPRAGPHPVPGRPHLRGSLRGSLRDEPSCPPTQPAPPAATRGRPSVGGRPGGTAAQGFSRKGQWALPWGTTAQGWAAPGPLTTSCPSCRPKAAAPIPGTRKQSDPGRATPPGRASRFLTRHVNPPDARGAGGHLPAQGAGATLPGHTGRGLPGAGGSLPSPPCPQSGDRSAHTPAVPEEQSA